MDFNDMLALSHGKLNGLPKLHAHSRCAIYGIFNNAYLNHGLKMNKFDETCEHPQTLMPK